MKPSPQQPRLIPLTLSLILTLALSGCDTSQGRPAPAEDDHHGSSWHYTEGRGLTLSPEGHAVLGVELAEAGPPEPPHPPEALTIPSSSLLRTIRGEFVYVRNGNHYLRTPVQTQSLDTQTLLVKDGLYEGDQVVISGSPNLWLIELQAINGGEACTHAH